MRRLTTLLATLMLLSVAGASPVAAGRTRCSIDVTPSTGSGTTVYRISGSDFPVPPGSESLEVRIDIQRTGSREGSIIFAFLVPGVTDFYFDYNQSEAGEPTSVLTAGRYRVTATTPHLKGCRTMDRFLVE